MNQSNGQPASVSDLVSEFIDSALATFETMVFMQIQPGAVSEKRAGEPLGGISSTISLTGEGDRNALLSLLFPMPLARNIFRSMMGMTEEDPVEDNEINDVVGELANMVAGGAKSSLQNKGVNFKLGLPTVAVGEQHHLEGPKQAETQVVEVNTDGGVFYMELSY